ncbi:MAG TPA: flagellar hook-basal body protein [Candidatus Polarisedimenticolia bacterium]|nr:flagellar hook-basal body protein [Candidatus Polarisedimenticolia bacterium]
MNSQLYTAASGLLAEERRLELITNNLANLSTPGYRAQRSFAAVYQPFGPAADASVRAANASVAIAGAYEVPGPGSSRATGRDLDITLDNDTFLVVSTPAGRRYTRDGSLSVSTKGDLIDAQGRAVLGSDGKPLSGLNAGAHLTADGRVQNGDAEVGTLLLVSDPQKVLRREGDNLLMAAGNDAALTPVKTPAVRPGFLEESGSEALGELVNLIETQRAFESYQKLISLTMNEVNRRAVNDLAG